MASHGGKLGFVFGLGKSTFFISGVVLTNVLLVRYGIVAPFIVLNARPGAIQHITFPVVARTSFGLWGSLWCTFNRGAMAW